MLSLGRHQQGRRGQLGAQMGAHLKTGPNALARKLHEESAGATWGASETLGWSGRGSTPDVDLMIVGEARVPALAHRPQRAVERDDVRLRAGITHGPAEMLALPLAHAWASPARTRCTMTSPLKLRKRHSPRGGPCPRSPSPCSREPQQRPCLGDRGRMTAVFGPVTAKLCRTAIGVVSPGGARSQGPARAR